MLYEKFESLLVISIPIARLNHLFIVLTSLFCDPKQFLADTYLDQSFTRTDSELGVKTL